MSTAANAAAPTLPNTITATSRRAPHPVPAPAAAAGVRNGRNDRPLPSSTGTVGALGPAVTAASALDLQALETTLLRLLALLRELQPATTHEAILRLTEVVRRAIARLEAGGSADDNDAQALHCACRLVGVATNPRHHSLCVASAAGACCFDDTNKPRRAAAAAFDPSNRPAAMPRVCVGPSDTGRARQDRAFVPAAQPLLRPGVARPSAASPTPWTYMSSVVAVANKPAPQPAMAAWVAGVATDTDASTAASRTAQAVVASVLDGNDGHADGDGLSPVPRATATTPASVTWGSPVGMFLSVLNVLDVDTAGNVGCFAHTHEDVRKRWVQLFHDGLHSPTTFDKAAAAVLAAESAAPVEVITVHRGGRQSITCYRVALPEQHPGRGVLRAFSPWTVARLVKLIESSAPALPINSPLRALGQASIDLALAGVEVPSKRFAHSGQATPWPALPDRVEPDTYSQEQILVAAVALLKKSGSNPRWVRRTEMLKPASEHARTAAAAADAVDARHRVIVEFVKKHCLRDASFFLEDGVDDAAQAVLRVTSGSFSNEAWHRETIAAESGEAHAGSAMLSGPLRASIVAVLQTYVRFGVLIPETPTLLHPRTSDRARVLCGSPTAMFAAVLGSLDFMKPTADDVHDDARFQHTPADVRTHWKTLFVDGLHGPTTFGEAAAAVHRRAHEEDADEACCVALFYTHETVRK